MHSMEGHHMDMGPHMKMTALRTPQPGDAEKAQKVVEVARGVMEKYKDYHIALDEGFKIFHPEVPQKQYHFTNYRYAFEAALNFNPEHPTSLLYEKDGDGYKLVGVMYTAPKRFTEDDLNQRIPLSIAQWHEHVNFCKAPEGHRQEMLGPNPKFGLQRIDNHQRRVRCRRRRVPSRDLQLDGASLPAGEGRGARLVGRSPARRLSIGRCRHSFLIALPFEHR